MLTERKKTETEKDRQEKNMLFDKIERKTETH